jgi:hypothetical protein
MEDFELEDNPFDEVFDSNDVINKQELGSTISKKGLDKERITDPEFNTKGFSQSDIDQLVNYDQERRKTLSFKKVLNEEIDLSDERQTQLENEFKDFLVYPRISGTSHLKGDKTIIPSSNVVKSNKIVEIVDAPKTKLKHNPATILVNRDETGDIDNIEIVCNCGDRILLKFDKFDHLDDELTKLETERLSGPLPFEEQDEHHHHHEIEKENEEDAFFEEDNSNKNKKVEKKAKVEKESEEEFFEEDFGVDDTELDFGGIDLSGI